jgi:hypothetical protein
MVGVIEQLVWEPEANNRSSKAQSGPHAEQRVTLHNPGDLPPGPRKGPVSGRVLCVVTQAALSWGEKDASVRALRRYGEAH